MLPIVLFMSMCLFHGSFSGSVVDAQTYILKSHVNMAEAERNLIDWGDLPLSFSKDQVFANDGWAVYVRNSEVWVVNKIYCQAFLEITKYK